MDALLLSRVQFALTTVYHFLFVPVTLGLSIFVALLETGSLFARTYAMRDRLRKLAKFFGGLFLINFAMGVVTGVATGAGAVSVFLETPRKGQMPRN